MSRLPNQAVLARSAVRISPWMIALLTSGWIGGGCGRVSLALTHARTHTHAKAVVNADSGTRFPEPPQKGNYFSPFPSAFAPGSGRDGAALARRFFFFSVFAAPFFVASLFTSFFDSSRNDEMSQSHVAPGGPYPIPPNPLAYRTIRPTNSPPPLDRLARSPVHASQSFTCPFASHSQEQ